MDKRLLKNFKDLNVLVIGDIILDEYSCGKATRLSQEAPVPVITELIYSHTLGGAANVANNINSLGANVTLVGVLGNLHNENYLIEDILDDKNITHHLIYDETRPTTKKTRLIVNGKQIARVDKESTLYINKIIETELIYNIKSIVDLFDIIILSDYKKGVLTDNLVKEVCNSCNSNKIITANFKNKIFTGSFDLVTLNEHESDTIFKVKDSFTEIHASTIDSYLESQEVELSNLMITAGDRGILLYDGKTFFPCEAYKVSVTDVSGAGDTVISVASLALASGYSIYEAALLANYGASLVVSKPGTATIDLKELKKFFKE